ncbi:MAG: FxLYD domain-containing protein [Leptotrichiaceae bacterium]|nr:FxLYD domain-containing protein [Leptotrichiaceae bacterium]
MKKIIITFITVLIISSCGVVGAAGSVVGGTIKAAGTVTGAVIKTTGNIISGIIGGNDGEIEAQGTKYRFSKAKVETDGNTTIVTGSLSHNGSRKENVSIQIPCFDKNGDKVGDAIDSTTSLDKNKKWEFRAVLRTGNVKACKAKDAYVYAE